MTAEIEATRPSDADTPGQTIFHEILRSNIFSDRKTTPRLADKATGIAIAGADTTASTSAALTYRVSTDLTMFQRLREELNAEMPSPEPAPDPKALGALPFLNALIEEILRIQPSGTHRQDQVAPDEALVFTYADGKKLHIPVGIVVSMTEPLVNRHPA